MTLAAGTLDRLNETVERAVRSSPYYAEAYRGLDTTIGSAADLRRLPLLTRETLVIRGYDMLAEGAVPLTVSMTGGTTAEAGGPPRPLLVFRGAEEERARRAVLDAVYGSLDPRPLILHLVNLGHGYDPAAGLEGAFQMAVERPFHVEAILSVLRRGFSFPGFTPRVTAVVGALRLLKALTLCCMERGIDGAEFAVELVSSTSSHLTSRWRALLAGYWRAEVDEAYGLSEVQGLHARRCLECGHFHFSPQAVAEVLRLDSDEPVERGPGRVVATSLYPMASIHPIIRYDTQDVVDVLGDCPAAGTFGFEFLGRRPDVVTLPGPEGPRVLVAPVALNQVLDSVPEIATEAFAFARPLGLRTTVGYQKWGLRPLGADGSLELEVELCWPPLEHCAAELEERLRERVLAAAPALAEAAAAGEVDFRIRLHGPGTTRLGALV